MCFIDVLILKILETCNIGIAILCIVTKARKDWLRLPFSPILSGLDLKVRVS